MDEPYQWPNHAQIPQTKITPPTPANSHGHPSTFRTIEDDGTPALGDDGTDAAYLFGVVDDIVDPEDDKTQGNGANVNVGINGRLPDAKKKIRDDGYKEIEKMFATLSRRTDIDIDRLILGYYRNFTHKTIAFHSWNTYQIYFKDNRDAELKRTYPPEKQMELDGTYIKSCRRRMLNIFQVPAKSPSARSVSITSSANIRSTGRKSFANIVTCTCLVLLEKLLPIDLGRSRECAINLKLW
jgi:hypothetical protein